MARFMGKRWGSWCQALWVGSVGFLLALTLPLRALDPDRSIYQYGRDRWVRQNGLPGSAVSGIYQLPGGYLWLHCGGGIYRFDGVRFTAFPLKVGGESINESIRALGTGCNGRMIIRTADRTLGLSDGRYTDLISPLRLTDSAERVVLEARDGTVWLGSDNAVFRLRNGKEQPVVTGVGLARSIMEDRTGAIWVATVAALYRIQNERIRCFQTVYMRETTRYFLPVEKGPASPVILPSHPSALMEDRNGVVWIGTLSGLWKYKNGVVFQDAETRGMGDYSITSLLQDRDGCIWAGTEGKGLFRLARGRWSSFGVVDGLSDDHVLSLHEDQEGSLWIGTQTSLDKLNNAAMVVHTTQDGLSNNDTAAVMEARDGSVFIFTAHSGITRWKGHSFQRFTTKDGLASNSAGYLFEAKDGTVWASTDYGLSAFRNGAWKTYMAGGRLAGMYVSAVTEDEESLIIAGSDLNLYRFKDDRLSPYDLNMASDGKPAGVRYAFTILRDREGTQWFAFSGGLYRVDPGQRPENATRTAFRDTPVCLSEDDRGYLWLVGSNTPGFARMKKSDGSLVQFPAEAGAKVDKAGRILCDGRGDVWVNTRKGILHFERGELDAFAEGRNSSIHSTTYGVLDGLQTEDCSGVNPQPAAWKGKDGRLFFTSRKGIVVCDPNHLPRNTLVPSVHIEEVMLGKDARDAGTGLVCDPGVENIEIHYSATSLRVPSRVRFKYQLVGFDPDWVDAGTRRTAYYTRIPPGSYRFRVVACNDDGVWNQEGVSFPLTFKPRFHQTLWFALLVLGLVTAGIVGIYRYRTRQLRKRRDELAAEVETATQDLRHHQEHLEQMVQERTSALVDANTHLQEEMLMRQKSEEQLRQSQKLESVGRLAGGVAHDFNNLLTVINGYTDLMLIDEPDVENLQACAQEIRKAGTRAADLTKQLLAFSRKQVLQPEVVDLNQLVLDMEKMLTRLLPESIQLLVKPDPEKCWVLADPGQMGQVVMNLAVNARDAMPESGQLLLEVHRSDLDETRSGEASLSKSGSSVCLSVTDTGIGMDESIRSQIFEPFFTTKGPGKGTGLGLSMVFGIVKQSGGAIRVQSEVGKGTSFQIFLPEVVGILDADITPEVRTERAVGGGTILVVEDQEAVRNLVVRTLMASGYQVLEASNGLEALKRAEEQGGCVDLLFTDVVMPVMNGEELARQVRAQWPNIRIVFTTGYAESLVADQGMIDAGVALLQKPFSPKQLLACIQRALGESH